MELAMSEATIPIAFRFGTARTLLEHDRDGAVVGELDGHAGAEDACRHVDPKVAQRLAEGFVDRLGLFRRCGGGEAGAGALPGVGAVRGMGEHWRLAAGVQQRAAEWALILPQYSQLRHR